jgi:hypothetical protein
MQHSVVRSCVPYFLGQLHLPAGVLQFSVLSSQESAFGFCGSVHKLVLRKAELPKNFNAFNFARPHGLLDGLVVPAGVPTQPVQ